MTGRLAIVERHYLPRGFMDRGYRQVDRYLMALYLLRTITQAAQRCRCGTRPYPIALPGLPTSSALAFKRYRLLSSTFH